MPESEPPMPSEASDPEEPSTSEADGAPGFGSFARCATCRKSLDVDVEGGTLLCKRFNMLVDADADEIPDDCLEYERDPDREPPPDAADAPPPAEPAAE